MLIVDIKKCAYLYDNNQQLHIGLTLAALGVPEVTIQNWKDVQVRIDFFDLVVGQKFPFEAIKLIGINVNCNKETQKQWAKRFTESTLQSMNWQMQKKAGGQ